MNKEIINKQFWNYVIPSMITMLLSGCYAIIDGLFVGNAIGNDGLAAINLIFPIQVILNAAAIGIGIGGAVVFSSCYGKQQEDDMTHAMASTLSLLLIAGVMIPVILFQLLPYLLSLLGAKDAIYDHAHSYIVIVLAGGILPILGNGLNPLLRNQGRTYLATAFMSCGLLTNILLDYLFVFDYSMGLGGAALATILAQGVVALLSFCYLWKHHFSSMKKAQFLPSLSLLKDIMTIGISPFGQTLAPSLVIVITNWIALRYGGNAAITIFSVVSYVLSSIQLLLQGIGDGVQPLISFYYGADKQKEVHYLNHKAFLLTLGAGIALSLLICICRVPLTQLFGISEVLMEPASKAVMITALSCPFIGITRLTSAFFYASEKTRYSTLLVYLEPCFLLPICLILFAFLFQVIGIWIAYPVAQILLSIIAIALQKHNVRTHSLSYQPQST